MPKPVKQSLIRKFKISVNAAKLVGRAMAQVGITKPETIKHLLADKRNTEARCCAAERDREELKRVNGKLRAANRDLTMKVANLQQAIQSLIRCLQRKGKKK